MSKGYKLTQKSVPGHLKRWKQDKVVSFLLVSATLGAYLTHIFDYLLGYKSLLKVIKDPRELPHF